jgi:capsular exopolysaccharide synthesis family protein
LSGPVIGSIPDMSRRENRALSHGVVPNNLLDVFNVTRNNLQLVMRHYTQQELWDRQVILFASAGPDEGKSMIASQIARSIAQSGHTVLLVDGNLRPDKEKESLLTQEPVGLAQVLTGEADIENVIVDSGIENLSLLPSGVSRGHTTDLVSMPSMPDTINRLKQKAEVVIVDSPACALATDALYLAPYADAVIQVIAMGNVDETVLADTVAAVQAASPKVTGYVLNRTPRAKRRGPRFHHYALELNGFNARTAGAVLNGSTAPLLTGATAQDASGAATQAARPAQSDVNDRSAQ